MTIRKVENGPISPAARKFVVHWGELGARWGINRTVAQIHALLYVSPKPLDVQTIGDVLGIARSNASTSIKELLGWGLVRPVHLLGDRREHYETVSDVWQMLTIVAEARKRREIDPTLAVLRECAAELRGSDAVGDRYVKTRVDAMLDLFETLTALLDEFVRVPAAAVRGVAALRGRLRTLLRVRG
jgi:DNA-binding transcriptional regulator GbsR (MarR family)